MLAFSFIPVSLSLFHSKMFLMRCFSISLSLLILFLYSKASENTNLLFVQILFRHGDRAPINLYPTDDNPESFWVEGLGKLTMLGRKQHFALGKFFRFMYQKYTTTSPLEISVQSSDCDRCMRSAEVNLASFYAPNSKWKFDNQLDWQPIPVFYVPKDEDKYLETDSYCPRATKEQERVVLSPEGQEFLRKYRDMFNNLTYYSGKPITNWTSASYLYDTLKIERKYNLSTPSWAIDYWDELHHVTDMSFYWSFNSPLLHRLRAGPLLQRIIEKMNTKISGEIPDQKIQIYSAHDTNVAVILDALQLFNMKQPPYCATLLFELHEINGSNAVRILYLNSTSPEHEIQAPHVLVLDGCTEFCPLDFFVNYTKDLIPENWEEECKLDQTFIEKIKETNITVALVFAMMAVVIVVMSIYSLWRLHSRGRDKYSYHLMPMN